MREIKLTQGKVALVDDQDYDTLSLHGWYADIRKNGVCYARRSSYPDTKKATAPVYMHHQVLGVKVRVDHKDGDGLNNQRDNLRLATHKQNNYNRRAQNGFKGVWFEAKRKKWGACVEKDGKKHHLGRFRCMEDAATAYNFKAQELFGEFAWYNLAGMAWTGERK